jgi:hypothetical protein
MTGLGLHTHNYMIIHHLDSKILVYDQTRFWLNPVKLQQVNWTFSFQNWSLQAWYKPEIF